MLRKRKHSKIDRSSQNRFYLVNAHTPKNLNHSGTHLGISLFPFNEIKRCVLVEHNKLTRRFIMFHNKVQSISERIIYFFSHYQSRKNLVTTETIVVGLAETLFGVSVKCGVGVGAGTGARTGVYLILGKLFQGKPNPKPRLDPKTAFFKKRQTPTPRFTDTPFSAPFL